MSFRHARVVAIAIAASVFAPALTAAALAAVSCGDTISADTRIGPADPIVMAPCQCPAAADFALRVVNPLPPPNRVVLDLGGRTIRGGFPDFCDVGILIAGDRIDVRNGTLTEFGRGVSTDTVTSGSTVASLRLFDNGEGIVLDAHGTTVRHSTLGPNAIDGVFIRGNNNVVTTNRALRNDSRGIVVHGDANTVSNNVSMLNGEEGFDIAGSRAAVTQNRAERNGQEQDGGSGFILDGTSHTLTLNNSLRNAAGSGFENHSADSVFDRNRGDYNAHWGFEDATRDGGTGGTRNIYTGNRCTGNTLGLSSPTGLCK